MAGTEVSSYPPLFRKEAAVAVALNLELGGGCAGDSESDPLAVVDLECMEMEMEMEMNKLKEVCREWGIFRLVNHGVPVTLLTQLEDHAKKLFGLSFESKESIFTTPVSYFWGSPALSKSGLPISQSPHNWVEGFNVPFSQLPLLHSQDPTILSFR